MGHGEGVFAIGLIKEGVEFFELLFQEGEVQRFKFLQDLVGEDEVKTIDFGATASDVDGDEGSELLHDTVTKREPEMADDEVIEFVELI